MVWAVGPGTRLEPASRSDPGLPLRLGRQPKRTVRSPGERRDRHEDFHSGSAGTWKKLGPWRATSTNGTVRISARAASHGAANFSGIELWSGDGDIPAPARPAFTTSLTPEHTAFFEAKIRPLLVDHCYECHSTTGKKLKGGLTLDSRAGMQQGGDTGLAVTPGDPDASLLIQAVRHSDASLAMPPNKKLAPHEIADLETWVRWGAPDPRAEDTVATAQARTTIQWETARNWWSFQPRISPTPPPVKVADWPANDLDRFILARLEHEQLVPAPDADPKTLIRRATFDLTGLPPRPEDVDAFVAHPTTEAFADVVDRLLASPQYGERWGRHWLDVVRYADSAGDNSDFPIPQMHRYRDWVIDAFNRDLPYDQLVRQQLAGDLLPASTIRETHDRLIATGYIANARRFGSRVDDYPQHLTIEDTLDNLGRAFLGLSLSCARCHDHKFDPISAADYYALYGIFQSTRYPWPGIELEQKQRDLVPLVESTQLAEAEAARKSYDQERRQLERSVQKLKDSVKETPAEQKEQVQAQIKEAEAALKEFLKKGLPFELAYAVTDHSKAQDATIQFKGDPAKPGPVVRRRFLTVLGGNELPEGTTTSGRRELAEWIVSPTNPLTARVMVNRIWLHHFGKGLVPTPNDFGKQGKAANPPRTARLARHSLHRVRLVREGHAPAHHELAHLPPERPAHRRCHRPGSQQRTPGFVPAPSPGRRSHPRHASGAGRQSGHIDLRSPPVPAAVRVEVHPAQSLPRRLRFQPPQRLPDDPAHSAASLSGHLRRRRSRRQHRRSSHQHHAVAVALPAQ
jgi:hypothetical protein